MVPAAGVTLPFTMARYSRCSRKNTSTDQMLGYDSQTGSVPVQTVTATEDERFSLFLIIPCERIGKGIIIIVHGRMNRHTGRFVD